MKDLSLLEQNINYRFDDKSLLSEALCHSSYANEQKGGGVRCNERLEFFGDAVLSEIVSEYLFKNYSDFAEGGLSAMRREIVDSETLAGYARSVGLGEYLLLGHGEEQLGGRDRRSNLEDAFEALVAAIYLDGGRDAARKFLIPFISGTAKHNYEINRFSDPKSKLQEIVQRGGAEAPVYVITGESGPDHDKHFECEVLVENNVMGHGGGHSKKDAEKAAAQNALESYFPADQ